MLSAISKIKETTGIANFDLIVDDGSHLVKDMALSLNVLSRYLAPNAIYIIEDINRGDLDFFKRLSPNGIVVIKSQAGVWSGDGFVAYRRS